jgi:hypothetical protein
LERTSLSIMWGFGVRFHVKIKSAGSESGK